MDGYPLAADTCRSSTCQTAADGATTVVGAGPTGSNVRGSSSDDGCLEDTIVQRYRPDGVHVSVFLASCLMWDGQRYPPGQSILTVAEAVSLAADPHWGVSMDARLVAEAAQRYPSLPEWVQA